MTTDAGMLIVGASLAGANAASGLRSAGYSGPVTLVGTESHLPYERPPLSKEYLQGNKAAEALRVHPADWYEANQVELRLGTTVTELNPGQRTVTVDTGEVLRYRKALLATGSSPRKLTLPGTDLGGVHYLRTLDDSNALRAALSEASNVVVIGGGWIGLETAAAARLAGLDVTVVETAALPLLPVLGPKVAEVFAALHQRHGVRLRTQSGVTEITGVDGSVSGVRLIDGEHVAADVVIVGIGASPNTALAERAGLAVDNGVLVDEHLRTSDPDIFAAGDVANAVHPLLGQRLRVEHWANARKQGTAAAQSMLGFEQPFDALPYFFTDQYDLGMEYTGYAGTDGYDDVVFRGDPDANEFMVFWLRQERVLAGMAVNIWDQMPVVAELIRSRQQVDRPRLADPAAPLT